MKKVKNEKNFNKRLKIINKIIIVFFCIIICKILFMTIVKNNYYEKLADSKTYKKIVTKAPRGEILDKNGELLAGNKTEFSIQILGDTMSQRDEDGKEYINERALTLLKLLEKNNIKYIDEYPIVIENEQFFYTFDEKINEFKTKYKMPKNYNAKKSFYYMVDILIEDGVLDKYIKNEKPLEIQKEMNKNGYYPPILVSEWKFTEEKNKEDWLELYGLETDETAKEAFFNIKSKEKYNIPEKLSDQDVRKILLVRDLINSNGYSKYSPITIAKNVNKDVIAKIEENSMNLRGVSVNLTQSRYYPNENLASHIIGYVGKIPSSRETELLENGYNKNDYIGITGVENSYEKQLKGKDGFRQVKVDSLGRVIQDLGSREPISGKDVYLTIDKNIQEIAMNSLEKTLKCIRTGSTFTSKYGNKPCSTDAPNAKSGAIMAVDIKSGDVLAMSSYPDYDLNKFANGISIEDYNDLMPENKNDVLAPNPLLNLATQAVFQPGSVFKMVTGMAALENGLSPNYAINDKGFIKLGNKIFGDYDWNFYGKNHGITNLYKAIEQSCNVYFYCIATAYNWMDNTPINIDMGVDEILEYAEKFGLSESTGLEKEISETYGTVPDSKTKLNQVKTSLKLHLQRTMKNAFSDINISDAKNAEIFEERINKIVSWADEENLSRTEIANRLTKLNVKNEELYKWTDDILYSYLNFAKWTTGDVFNLAIGQGENAYTPAQIVRYVSAIANNGKLNELSVVNKVVSDDKTIINKNKSKKIEFKDSENLSILTEGMGRVATQGTAKGVFADFPVEVAVKTGTAEKSGKIPKINEYEYLMTHLSSYNVEKEEVLKIYNQLKLDREKQLSKEREGEIKKDLKSNKIEKEEKQKLELELKRGISVKLENTDKINAYYLRKAIKSINTNITDERIDEYKVEYGEFSWAVAFAPKDNPEIAVVCMIPQGETSTYALYPIREVLGQYFNVKVNASENIQVNGD